MTKDDLIRPVILSGGSGTRMWPLSRKSRPKQFHRLLGATSLFQMTAARVSPKADARFAPPIILAAAEHAALIADELAAIDVDPHLLILEPVARNTAAAIAAVAVAAARTAPDEILVVLPADHMIGDQAAFREALKIGVGHAAAGRIVTFGIEPDRPETGYGYIQCGGALGDRTHVVAAFREKPDGETAARYIETGEYLWNGGIFMFRADIMIAELKKHRPALLEGVEAAVSHGDHVAKRLMLDADRFGAVESDSIDYAVMEHTDRAAVVSMNVGWSDVGSWASLWEVLAKDGAGNAAPDDAFLLDSADTLIVSDGPAVAAIGVSDLLIVATKDGVLVARKDNAQDVREIVAALKARGRTDLL